jgi:hypothetical protein
LQVAPQFGYLADKIYDTKDMGKQKRIAQKKRRKALKQLFHSPATNVSPQSSKFSNNPLIPLAQALSRFEPADLLAAVAGLQLMPENADRTIRLEALAHTVASLEDDNTTPQVSPSLLGTICNSWPLDESAIASAEDPFENLFTESFTFYGGSYTVFPGINEEATYVLKHLSMGLFRHPDGFAPDHFQRDAAALIHGVLSLSDEIARRAELDRGVEPVSAPGGGVIVPDEAGLIKLKGAATFSASELARVLTDSHLPSSTLDDLVIQQGEVKIEEYRLGDSGTLLAKPIVLTGDKYVVAIPGALLPACRHALIRRAKKCGVASHLAERYNLSVWNNVMASLNYMGNSLASLRPPKFNEPPLYQDAFFSLDRDKLLYTLLITDPLNDYEDGEVFGMWPPDDLQEKIETRLEQIEEFVYLRNLANEMLLLVVVQGVGRWFSIGFSKGPISLFLTLRASSMETISWLEGADPLLLWKYARASSRIRDVATVMATSDLDEFHFYRSRDYGYYASDDVRPNFIVMSPGGAGALRTEVLVKRDWHGVPSLRPGRIVEVTTIHDTRKIPVYASPDIISGRDIEILVEGLPLPFWIVNSPFENETQERLFSIYMQFADAIAYWLWQFTPSLVPILPTLTLRYSHILIQIRLLQPEGWQIRSNEPDDIDSPIEVVSDFRTGTIRVDLRPRVFSLVEGPENNGERELMRQVLTGLCSLMDEIECPSLSDEVVTGIINLHAPIGNKKMIMTLDLGAKPELDPRDLPRFRERQQADVSELLDDLGTHLIEDEGMKVGPIADTERTALINNEIVPFYFKKLHSLVSSLSPSNLLEWLIRHHESVLHEVASHKLTLPTRLSCFSSEAEMVERLIEELPERNIAAAANRFVIEYVVAQPPSGYRPISLSVYDRLLALAAEIINNGSESDFIHFGLADNKFSILPSGRLGVDRTNFVTAHEAFNAVAAAGELTRSTNYVKRHWHRGNAFAAKTDLAIQIDNATTKEFGHTLTELLNLLVEARNISAGINPTLAFLPLAELVSQLATRLGWSLEKVEQAVDLFSLKPRKDFFKPPSPHRIEDVFPWRFNRSLSYLRRPFLYRQTGNEIDVLWGNRSLHSAWTYLITLCMEGRLRAQSREMRQVLGKINNLQGADFNDRVADVFENVPDQIVKRRVKKVGHLRLSGPHGDLGDIDVLAVDTINRVVRAVECKDLAVGRTPFEMANEITNLFRGQKGNRSIIERHQKRVDWVKQHLKEVLEWLDLDTSLGWSVDGLVVVDRELFTPHLEKSSMSVIPLHELIRSFS